jgi:hypothetical protein
MGEPETAWALGALTLLQTVFWALCFSGHSARTTFVLSPHQAG